MADTEQQIRERAYALWQEEGRPEGRDLEHWHRAAREVPSGAGEALTDPEVTTPQGNGLTSGLQPGGTLPGGGPAAGMGSIGTGGGSTANKPTGAARR